MKDTGKVSAASVANHFIGLLGSLVLARILSPTLWAYWKGVQLAVTYTAFANYGAHYGLSRSCPAMVTRRHYRTYRLFMRSAMTFSALMGFGLGAIFLGHAIFEPPGSRRVALLFLSLLVMVQQFYMIGETALVVEKKFGKHSLMILLVTTVRVVLAAVGAWFFGLAGALGAYWLTVVLGAAYSWSRSRLTAADAIPRPPFRGFPRSIVRVGAPITVLTVAELLFLTLDRWLALALFVPSVSGLYLFALYAEPILLVLPKALRATTSIDIYDKYTRLRDLAACGEVYRRSVMVVALGSPVLMGAVFLGVPWLVEWLLPAFRPAIPTIKLFSVALYPVMIVQTAFAIVVVTKREFRVALMMTLTGAAMGCVTFALAMTREIEIMHVLLVHAGGWTLFGVALTFQVSRWLGASSGVAAGRVLKWFLPMAFLAVQLPALEWVLVHGGQALGVVLVPHTFTFGVVGGVLHVLVCAPMLWGLEKRTGAVSYLLRRLGVIGSPAGR